PDEVAAVNLGALFHDIGKIGIPEHILRKPTALTEEEWAEMKTHPIIGANLIGEVPNLERIRPIVLAHHERYDGSGYPNGLRADEIPLAAQIIAVADTYEAMTSTRPYRAALSHEAALAKTIAARCGAEVLQADDVWLALQRAIDPDTRPTLHFFARETVWDRPIEELVTAMRVLADEVSAALEPVTAHHLRVRDRIVIEGVWITPAFAARKAFGGSTYDGAVRSVFI